MTSLKIRPQIVTLQLVIIILTAADFCFAKSLEYNNLDGKCYDMQSKRELYIGEYFQRWGQCIRVQCLGDLTLWEDKCNDPMIKGHCIKEYLHPNDPYPGCCPLYKCEEHFGSSKEIKVLDHYGNVLSHSITSVVHVEDNVISSDPIPTIKVTI